MKRKIACCVPLLVLILILGAAAKPAGRFDGLYESATGGSLLHVQTGGGSGGYVSLAEQRGLVAFIRLDQPESDKMNLGLFDLKEGKLIAQTSLLEDEYAYYEEVGFLDGGGISLLNQYRMTLLHFDRDLKETLRFTVPGGAAYRAAYEDRAGRHLYCAGEDGIVRFTLPGGEKTPISLGLPEGWLFSTFAGERNGRVLSVISSPDGLSVTGAIDANGRLYPSPIPAAFTPYPSGHIILSGKREALVGTLPYDGVFSRISDWNETEYASAWQDGLLLTGNWDEKKPLRLMDLEAGTLVSQLMRTEGESALFLDNPLLSEDGYALFSAGDYEEQAFSLCLWDYSKDPLDLPVGVTRVTMADIRKEQDREAEQIALKHGVGIHIRQDGASFENDTYQARQADDVLRVSDALRELDAFFSKLPPGMTEEATVSPKTRFGIYLCGEILPKNASGIASASGFASGNGEERYIALNVRDGSFMRNLAHEFMHVMEDRLWETDQGLPESLLRQWGRLGPKDQEGHGFAFSYHNPDMTEWADSTYSADAFGAQEDPEDVWFIDAYSRTFPLEDRARIFEYLFTAGDTSGTLFSYPNLLLKAQCLSAIIRNAFPSVQALSAASWEKLITPIPYETLMEMLTEILPEEEELPAAG